MAEETGTAVRDPQKDNFTKMEVYCSLNDKARALIVLMYAML